MRANTAKKRTLRKTDALESDSPDVLRLQKDYSQAKVVLRFAGLKPHWWLSGKIAFFLSGRFDL
jgi:hypothetical protein